jgi:hypothetical protein
MSGRRSVGGTWEVQWSQTASGAAVVNAVSDALIQGLDFFEDLFETGSIESSPAFQHVQESHPRSASSAFGEAFHPCIRLVEFLQHVGVKRF